MTEGVHPTIPTVVYDSDLLHNHGLVHRVIESHAVPGKEISLVTSYCSVVGLGRVKLRRGANCLECRDALERAATRHLDERQEKK